MDKKLSINIYAEANVGRVDIIGDISEWNDNNASQMRTKCHDLQESGVTSCLVYLMTSGGDCFQANEIVNILIEYFGEYNADGGALVASAGSYIGAKAKKFEQVENGQLMIHKPMGEAWGNETEVENYLQLIKNMTETYYEAYKLRLKKPEADFKEKWDNGDFWMTSQQAKEWGFIDGIKGKPSTDAKSNALLKAMGHPPIQEVQPKNKKEMDLKAIAVSLGMPEDSTEDQVNARIKANAKKAGSYDTLKAKDDQRQKEELSTKVEAKLKSLQKEKKIKAESVQTWREKLTADYEGTCALTDSIPGVATPLSEEVKPSADGNGATYKGKTFEQLQDESPEVLEALMDENLDAYDKLFADWKKRNGIK